MSLGATNTKYERWISYLDSSDGGYYFDYAKFDNLESVDGNPGFFRCLTNQLVSMLGNHVLEGLTYETTYIAAGYALINGTILIVAQQNVPTTLSDGEAWILNEDGTFTIQSAAIDLTADQLAILVYRAGAYTEVGNRLESTNWRAWKKDLRIVGGSVHLLSTDAGSVSGLFSLAELAMDPSNHGYLKLRQSSGYNTISLYSSGDVTEGGAYLKIGDTSDTLDPVLRFTNNDGNDVKITKSATNLLIDAINEMQIRDEADATKRLDIDTVDQEVRPEADDAWSLGTSSNKFADFYSVLANITTCNIATLSVSGTLGVTGLLTANGNVSTPAVVGLGFTASDNAAARFQETKKFYFSGTILAAPSLVSVAGWTSTLAYDAATGGVKRLTGIQGIGRAWIYIPTGFSATGTLHFHVYNASSITLQFNGVAVGGILGINHQAVTNISPGTMNRVDVTLNADAGSIGGGFTVECTRTSAG